MADTSHPDESRFLAKKRNRKLSWVGVEEDSPYSYLRESMVSSLMGGICDPQFVTNEHNPNNLQIPPERKQAVVDAIGSWSFSAHDFTDDELLYADLLMLEHALQMPELEKWKMSTGELISFLLASKAAYNEFVLYHNFRHVSDVLQAIFFFLVSIGTLPPYPTGSEPRNPKPTAIAALLTPFDGLTLLISAIGHDVGHPGVNNAFLVALNAPLAQLYNDRSVLESFHCAAYSQILRRHWPQTFSDTRMRKLMIESILATDMGLHFKYMSDLGNLQEKLAHNNRTTDGWSVKILEEYRDLTCGLLIKCADISNVARKFQVAAKWADILTDEFANQGQMETRLSIPSCLFGGPPVQDDRIKLGQSQIGFMNVFARPLFDAVTDILPAMQFSVDELQANKERWSSEIAKEKERQFQAHHTNKAPGLLHLRGLQRADFLDGSLGSPSPKSSSTEFLLGNPPTSNAPPVSKSPSDPHPLASIEEQAEAKRKMFNPGNFNFSDNGSSDHEAPGVSSDTQNSVTPSANTSTSRRGSADATLTTLLVTQGQGDKTKVQKDKRASGENPAAAVRNLSPNKNNQKTPSGSQAASEKGITLAPDEGPGAMNDWDDAYLRSDSVAVGEGMPSVNGAVVSPGAKNGNGTASGTQESMSSPQALGPVISGQSDGATEETEGDGEDDKKKKKFGLSKLFKRKWRAVSGLGDKEGMKSRERLAVGSRGNDAPPLPKAEDDKATTT